MDIKIGASLYATLNLFSDKNRLRQNLGPNDINNFAKQRGKSQ